MDSIKFSRIAIISTDAKIADEVSSHFRKPGIYLPLFDISEGPVPPKDSLIYGAFKNDCTKILNAIRTLNSEYTILLRCRDDLKLEISSHFSSEKLIVLDSVDKSILSRLPGFRSKQTFVDLGEIDKHNTFSGNIIAIENNAESISTIIAKNLAVAEKCRIVKLPETDYDEVKHFRELFRVWMQTKDSLERESAKNSILSLISGKLGLLSNINASTISFITRGIPYGIHPFACPTTHYFSHRLLGLQILLGMLKTQFPHLGCTSVYLCDPGEFDHSESEQLSNHFASKNFVIKETHGPNASARDATYSTQYLPVDFIFYSTHCGEVKGRRIKERFTTSNGVEHTIVYDSVVEFAPKPGSEKIQVFEQKWWVSIDNVNWDDDEQKERINAGAILEEYLEWDKNCTPEQVVACRLENIDIGIIRGSSVLKMHDFNFMPMLHQVGGYRYPFVFNNACSSWRELAVMYAIAGAAVYIGASVDISNYIAVDVATKFVMSILDGRTIGYSLFNAQKDFVFRNQYTPYLMFGYIFSKFRPCIPRVQNSAHFEFNLKRELALWNSYHSKIDAAGLRESSSEIVNFLTEQLDSYLALKQ